VSVRDQDDVSGHVVLHAPRIDVHDRTLSLPSERRLPEPRDPVQPHPSASFGRVRRR
jgi:hypothetical protein